MLLVIELNMPIRNSAEPKQLNSSSEPGRGLAILTLLVLFLIAAGGFAWSYNGYAKTKKELSLLTDPKAKEEVAKKETAELVNSLKRLVVLPENETPTIATVTDAAAMAQEQPFYKDAHNGDKLLVYTQARKAYIYDPTRNILVNVGPIYIDENASATSTVELQQLNVDVRNGSNTAGVGTLLANELKKDLSITVVSASNADNKDYQGNIIVDFTAGVKTERIKILADKIGAKVVDVLPTGERASSAEALVIVGN